MLNEFQFDCVEGMSTVSAAPNAGFSGASLCKEYVILQYNSSIYLFGKLTLIL